MSILSWFKKISGLGINVDKTEAVKIGALRDRSLPWEGRYGMEWTDSLWQCYDYKISILSKNHPLAPVPT